MKIIIIRTLVNHLSWLKVWLEDSLPTGWIILINKILILIPIIHPYLYLTNCSKYLPGFLIGILLSFGIFCFFLCFAGCFCEETFHNMNSLCEVWLLVFGHPSSKYPRQRRDNERVLIELNCTLSSKYWAESPQ